VIVRSPGNRSIGDQHEQHKCRQTRQWGGLAA
jgi:hypothetical protein